MTLLDVQHVKKIYKTRFKGNQVEALKDIHFTVEKGEYVAIMGESGSGKSTLLNILAMLDKPTAGRVYLNGMDTATIKNKDASSFRREKLGFVSRILTFWIPYLLKIISYYLWSFLDVHLSK